MQHGGRIVLVCALALAGCKAGEQCTAAVTCAAGSYKACTSDVSCRIVASSGDSFDCASCADCQAATARAVAWCGQPAVGGNGSANNGGGSDAGVSTMTQPLVCASYLACMAQLSPVDLPSLIVAYGPSGSCWQSTSMLAASCAQACQTGLADARTGASVPAACLAASPPDMSTPATDMVRTWPADMATMLTCSPLMGCILKCGADTSCQAACQARAKPGSYQLGMSAFSCGENYCLGMISGAPPARCAIVNGQIEDAPGQPSGACEACYNKTIENIFVMQCSPGISDPDCEGGIFCESKVQACINDNS